MVRSLGLGLLLAILASIVIWFVLDPGPSDHLFQVEGRIIGFSEDKTSVFIEHEDIPGYMPSMTMPFSVRDTSELKDLETGDAVSFSFHVTDSISWIDDLMHIPIERLDLPASDPIFAESVGTISALQPGDVVSGISLVDQDSVTFDIAELRGKPTLVTFIYTRCPVPDLCPRMSTQFQSIQRRLAQENLSDKIRLLTISFDPEFDTPSVLREYASRYTNDLSNWTFATGSVQAIANAATKFGVTYRDDNDNLIEHNLATALISPDGTVSQIWRGNTWSIDKVISSTLMYVDTNP